MAAAIAAASCSPPETRSDLSATISVAVGATLTATSQTATPAAEVSIVASPMSPTTITGQRGLPPTYPDQQRDDRVTSLGQPVTLSGMRVIVSDPRLDTLGVFGSGLCVNAAYQNVDNQTRRFSWTDWRLQLPNGVVTDAAFHVRPDALDSADLVAGGRVDGIVCFNDSGQKGQHILIWKPSLFERARGIWLISR